LGEGKIARVNRVGFAVGLAAAIFAAVSFFLLKASAPDDVGDGAAPESAAVRALPPQPDSPSARDTNTPAPRAPEPPPGPKRRTATATPATEPPPDAPVAATTATLRVVSDVPGAQVFLNREFVGATPATALDLQPGSYQLNVSAPGYDNHVESLELTAGEREVNVRFREVRLDAAIDVVHKHRFGSCKGRLLATPQGVRYETADTDDAFETPLANLETFQVDYLNKNLRLQPRKGKRYDFTDPDGNADRLFVFHRDVDRARERLKKSETP
jgi:hypothetical protein